MLCVCVVPLKIFLNFARGTIFRNIEISEYRAFLHFIKYDEIWYCAREAQYQYPREFSCVQLSGAEKTPRISTVKSESKSAVTRLLPDQYLSNLVILFTTN